MKHRRFWFLVVLVILFASCASSGDDPDSWSRTYFAPRDDVIEAVIDVLEDDDYFVDADREEGRIVAEPPRSAGNLAALVVNVRRKGDRVLVDVLARPGSSYSTMASRPAESAVLEFFHELGLRLEGRAD
jgi:hypothetical protein